MKAVSYCGRCDLRRCIITLPSSCGQRMQQSTSACNRGFDSEHVQEQTGQVLARYEQ